MTARLKKIDRQTDSENDLSTLADVDLADTFVVVEN